MPGDATPTNLKSIPLFADLEESKLEDFLRIFQLVSFSPGACLMTQGHVADSVFFLERGAVEVVVMLPGGDEKIISTLGSGSVIGEMALLDEVGTRTATVRALTTISGFLVERQDCRALLTQVQPTAFTVQRRITLSLCQRLREVLAMVVRVYEPDASPSTMCPEELDLLSGVVRHKKLEPRYREILPHLPFFSSFRADEIDTVLEQAAVLELPRGQVLCRQGSPGRASYLIVRGAVELVSDTGSRYILGVLGPGGICGQLALIDGAAHEVSAAVQSDAILLELSRPSFDQLFTDGARPAMKFQHAVLQSLLMLEAKTDNHLARVMSQADMRTHRSAR